jgi:hypothetical protein
MTVEKSNSPRLHDRSSYLVPDKTPQHVAIELFTSLQHAHQGIQMVHFEEGSILPRSRDFQQLQLWHGGWSLPRLIPQDPYAEVLNWRGAYTSLEYVKESTMLDGSNPFLKIHLEDRGNLRIMQGELDFHVPYPDRNGRLFLSIKGSLPGLDMTEPKIQEPTTVDVIHYSGNPGSLIQTASEYILSVGKRIPY